jgi:hypothetical protein
VIEIAARLAAETGTSAGEVARRTSENFYRLFAKAT